MSQQGNFVGGFLLGSIVGGVVGGVIGALAASRLSQQDLSDPENTLSKLEKANRKRQLKAPTEQSIEAARRGLEDKIAQLNDAIDDVRQQLGAVNGAPSQENGERVTAKDL
jgi:gas vesicle protein